MSAKSKTMTFVGEPQVARAVVERRFEVESGDASVPGVLWTPEDAEGERPLVLLGHGGTRHKRVPEILGLARRLVRHHGFAAAAIDAVGHGARRSGDPRLPERLQPGDDVVRFLAEVMGPNAFDRMCADWQATLTALRALPDVGAGPLGYWGLSMGTLLGIPFVASEPQVRVAVLGLMGAFGRLGERLSADAGRITCPVLFLLQLDDELVPFDGGVGLFRDLGTSDKRLHAHPGRHAAVPGEEANFMEDFLVRHLAPG